MNSADNFRGAEIGTVQRIDIYFESALSTGVGGSYDRVRLIVDAAGNEEKALEAIAGALQGNKSGLTVMADDKNSVYFSDFFTGVDSFTTASLANRRITETITAAKGVEASDSGKLFLIDQDAPFAITLPTVAAAGSGWYADFIINDEGANAVTIVPDASEDTVIGFVMSGDGGSGNSTDSTAVDEIKFISGAQQGDRVSIFCDGVKFFAYAMAHDAAHIEIA
tara:strand:+ start:65 stop:733 length:669 start_codon:yes stop_codon:yes gene_type:complete